MTQNIHGESFVMNKSVILVTKNSSIDLCEFDVEDSLTTDNVIVLAV